MGQSGVVFFNKVYVRTPCYSFRDYGPGRLQEVLKDAVFRNAVWLSSPVFFRELEKKSFEFTRLHDKEKFTLAKYLNRMCYRPTPFGLFSSYTLTNWSMGAGVAMDDSSARLHLLPSLEWMEAAGKFSGLTGDMELAINPTLYRVGPNWRYTMSTRDASGRYAFALHGLEAVRINNFVVSAAGKRPVSADWLTAELSGRAGCSPEEASGYIRFLVEAQVLYAASMPGLLETGKPLSRDIPGGDLARYDQPGYAISGLPYYTALERKNSGTGLPQKFSDDLSQLVSVLHRIVLPQELRTLTEFRDAFRDKFEDQYIPLLTALDPDAGIAYGNLQRDPEPAPLLDAIPFPEGSQARNEVTWTAVHRMFLRIWLENANRGYFDTVRIRETDLEDPDLAANGALPPGISFLFSGSGRQTVLDSCGGASSTALMGRFTVFGEESYAAIRELAKQEIAANPDVVFAELHQLSHLKVDNVNRRRPVFDYVIPLNTFPHHVDAKIIWPSDLFLSVRRGEVILESRSLGKRVVPRLPTAYNHYHNELPLFRLLCDLQYQGLQASLVFDPEKLFPGMAFYPRIRYGNTIISLARWHLRKEEFNLLSTQPYSIGRLHIFRQERGIPRHVSLGRSDQQLVFDLANDAEAIFFMENLRDAGEAVIREYLPPDNSVVVNGREHCWQGVAFWTNKETVYQGAGPVTANDGVTRAYLPGDNWLYVKFYCTPQSADRILSEILMPVLRRYRKKVLCWFFIRYQDRGHHLRVRIKMKDGGQALLFLAFSKAVKSYGNRDLVRDFGYDTYKRELERYGAANMELVEDCFWAGSRWAAELVSDELRTTVVPIVLAYDMCRLFIPPGQSLLLFLEGMKDAFLAELHGGAKLKTGFDRRYREISRGLESGIEQGGHPALKSKYTADLLNALDLLAANVQEKRQQLVADLVHMQFNRIYASRQRHYEALAWLSLYRYEASRIARAAGISQVSGS